MFEPGGPRASVNGCCRLENFKGGATVLNLRDLIVRFYFAVGVQLSARLILSETIHSEN